MAAQVYTFHITYEGTDCIWRKIEVSSNFRLDRLGYTILAAFDTMAYHLFSFRYCDREFEIPDEDGVCEGIDMASVSLNQMELKIGDRVQMNYDYGTTQTFWLQLVGIENMRRGWGRRYPYVLEGAGQGIIDDMSGDEIAKLITQIDRNGKTDEPVYYRERIIPWDYRRFDLKSTNALSSLHQVHRCC